MLMICFTTSEAPLLPLLLTHLSLTMLAVHGLQTTFKVNILTPQLATKLEYNTTLRLSAIPMVIILYLFLEKCERAHQSTPTSIRYVAALGDIIYNYPNITLNSTKMYV